MTDRKDWFSPHSIRFTKPQVRYLIPLLPQLRVGEYPRDPKESGYTDQGIQGRQFRAGAAFETPAGIAAECDLRISKCGIDGLLLELLYTVEPEDELFFLQHLAMSLNEDIPKINKRIKNALAYCSGNGRKARTYKQFIHHEKGR